MEYICHRPYNKKGASGKFYNLKPGARFDTIGKFIAYRNAAICTTTSEDAYRYFARNDDGQGMKRGKLTYEIAFSERKPNEEDGYRFTPKEREILSTDYARFIRQDSDMIIFNSDFFNAEISELEEIREKVIKDV